ncbi:mitochondrial calcium uniporter regulator 1 isoform X2 [Numida meleagris]|uniref:mitochondrial calcium uniporter regulator 1 isoform X2 n=1 Tax=Numida meleagris TaxID=8996 RepID=UPI000B3DA795|nr:mitochondrial calcium uniporter regulator 1 isoform X2 [Numida meleagris]
MFYDSSPCTEFKVYLYKDSEAGRPKIRALLCCELLRFAYLPWYYLQYIKRFTTQQSEVIVSALVKIVNTNLDMIYKDMVTKVQQEIALQQVMSHIGGVKKDMIILEKSEFSALRSENEKIKLELQQIKKQVTDEITKVRADNKLNLNLEKSRVKELHSLNERKLLEMRTEIVELHAQQDRALTQTDRKIDTEVADLKTMLESHKLDNIKYLAGSVFTCLTVALGFYRLWM